jgi:hypothetical protein
LQQNLFYFLSDVVRLVVVPAPRMRRRSNTTTTRNAVAAGTTILLLYNNNGKKVIWKFQFMKFSQDGANKGDEIPDKYFFTDKSGDNHIFLFFK